MKTRSEATKVSKPKISNNGHDLSEGFRRVLNEEPRIAGYPSLEERPCYRVHKNVWNNGTRQFRSGVYHHNSLTKDGKVVFIDKWLCAPLEILAITVNREDSDYGRLVAFTSLNGQKKRLAIPARLFAGSSEQIRSELLNLGLEMSHRKDERMLLFFYLANSKPSKFIYATSNTGWYDRQTFVFPDQTIGQMDVCYQSKDEENPYSKAGTFEDWRKEVASLADGNPNIMLCISCSFAATLFYHFNVPGGGVNLFGDSSIGKTTALRCGESCLGGEKVGRTWNSTACGLEAIAKLSSDLMLSLDELHLVEPKVLSNSIYSLVNGSGRTRGNIHGMSRPIFRWRTLILSSGEVSIETHLTSDSVTTRAGQAIRMLDIPVEGKYGAFDDLHGFTSAAAFANSLRDSATKHYGHAVPLFVRKLIAALEEGIDLPLKLMEIQEVFEKVNMTEPQRRAARTFAIIALAGELAIEWQILPWAKGQATEACLLLFRRWRSQTVISAASSPNKKILMAIKDSINRYGSSRFSDVQMDLLDVSRVNDRMGYWMDVAPRSVDELKNHKKNLIYLFTSTGLKEATKGYEFKQVTRVLDEAGAFYEKDKGQRSVNKRTPTGQERLYCIDPSKLI